MEYVNKKAYGVILRHTYIYITSKAFQIYEKFEQIAVFVI